MCICFCIWYTYVLFVYVFNFSLNSQILILILMNLRSPTIFEIFIFYSGTFRRYLCIRRDKFHA